MRLLHCSVLQEFCIVSRSLILSYDPKDLSEGPVHAASESFEQVLINRNDELSFDGVLKVHEYVQKDGACLDSYCLKMFITVIINCYWVCCRRHLAVLPPLTWLSVSFLTLSGVICSLTSLSRLYELCGGYDDMRVGFSAVL